MLRKKWGIVLNKFSRGCKGSVAPLKLSLATFLTCKGNRDVTLLLDDVDPGVSTIVIDEGDEIWTPA